MGALFLYQKIYLRLTEQILLSANTLKGSLNKKNSLFLNVKHLIIMKYRIVRLNSSSGINTEGPYLFVIFRILHKIYYISLILQQNADINN